MARPLRISLPNAWHHVMNRGLARCRIFRDDDDRRTFLEVLAECGQRWDVWAGAVVLLPNHYHLVVHDRSGKLSRAMRHLDGVYTQHFNRRHRRDGPLMRGRFRSRVVEANRYLLEVIRYVHANPVRAGLVEHARDYKWSSHRYYLGGPKPGWLRPDLLLDVVGAEREQRRWFDRFVHERVDEKLAGQLGGKRWAPVLGDEAFVERIRRKVRESPPWSTRDVPEGRRLAALTVDEVIAAALRTFGRSREELLRGRRGRSNVPRLVTLLMCREHTGATTVELSGLFGVRAATLTGLAVRARGLLAEDREAAQAMKRLRAEVGRIVQTAT